MQKEVNHEYVEHLRLRFRACLHALLLIYSLLLFSGCATTAQTNGNRDPLEKINRPIHNLNHALDTAFLSPVVETYVKVFPKPLRSGVSNVFSNLGEPNVIINDILQGKLNIALSDTMRFIVNSTIGLGGILDPGTQMGFEKHHEDYGQTFALWGFGEGPYLVLPLSGPTTLRDLPGSFLSAFTNPLVYINEDVIRIAIGALGTVNTRANNIDNIKNVDESAIDRYIFVREAFRNNRTFNIYDGNPPVESMLEDDLYFDDDELFEVDEGDIEGEAENEKSSASPTLEGEE
jgi:phospholipid-binding lipoprotein MlaA